MKRITALAACLVVAAAAPPRALAWGAYGAGRDGEVRAVSVLPADKSVDVVIELQGGGDVQEFTLASPPRPARDPPAPRGGRTAGRHPGGPGWPPTGPTTRRTRSAP